MYVIFDLDGTLADASHRLHFIEKEQKDWDGFFAACGDDEPIWPMIRVLKALDEAGVIVNVWTGRSEITRAVTESWLRRYGIWPVRCKMRGATDRRTDVELKAGWLDELGVKPDLVFEDRIRMVEMYRERGIRCLQVGPGNY